MIDVRTFEARNSLRASGYRVATNWSRACLSPDARYAAAGSVDGTVFVWNTQSGAVEKALKGHTGPVLSCSWSDRGRPLASADKNGNVVTWE
jgi:autophagy-related protein 16